MATRSSPGAAVDHVSSVTIRGIRGIALAIAAAAAVSGGAAIHHVTERSSAHGTAVGAAVRPSPSAAAATRPAIPDVPWLVERGDGAWIHGRGADPSPVVLPDGETGLAIDDRFLASTRAAGDGHSIVRVRDVDSDAVAGEVEMPIWVSAGAWTEAGLVVTGYADSTMTADGGLVLLDPVELTTRTLVEPGPFAAALGTPVARGEVLASPSRRLVASNACGVRLCETQVVDVTTAFVTRPVRASEGFLRAVTDDSIVTTDGDGAGIAGRRIGDGSVSWRLADAMLLDPLAEADGSVVGVVGSRESGWAVTRLDGGGRRTDVTKRSTADRALPRIWREVSTPTRAVVGLTPFADVIPDLGSADLAVVTVVDPATEAVR